MTHADRMEAIGRTAHAVRCSAELSLACGHQESTYKNQGIFNHFGSDIPYLLARISALEAALGEAIQEMSENAPAIFVDKPLPKIWQDIDRLTAIKEGTTDAD